MSQKFEKLTILLRELFQLDQADLDFGIYRIMNQKRDEVERFLDGDLLPQVRAAFEKYRPADKAALQAELDKLITGINAAGMHPEESPKVQELRKRLAQGVDIAALEDEVFSDLFTFFRRYYHGGDFLSLRRYKEGVYAIPYEGEEVKLHWANHDQYYIKSAEHLTNYTFKVGKRRVRFELAAAGTERDNNKAPSDAERRFLIADEDPVVEDGDDLIVHFEYQPDADKRKQDALNSEAAVRVLDAAPAAWKDALRRKVPTKANPDRTLLDQHIRSYTAKNTFDYFIHKDLGGFLRRELDFFIKNEILLLDDIDQIEDFAKVEEKLSKIRVLRSIAHKVIAFLAQLEDFQKKLWLKKKFVVETNWCITLDRIPEEFYEEIAANEAQREEWVRLFAIDEIEGDMVTAAYTVPLSVDFLRANPGFTVNTALFDLLFTERVLERVERPGHCESGLLVHGDNTAALRLLESTHLGCVDAIYLDPPYNTGNDGFMYKDGYQASTWLSMMSERLVASRGFLSKRGVVLISIDDNSYCDLVTVGQLAFGEHRYQTTFAWQKKDTPANDSQGVSTTHEYVLMFPVGDEFRRGLIPRSEEQLALYKNQDDDRRGPWTRTSLVVKRFVKGNDFPLSTPGGKVVRPPTGQGWAMTRERLQELIDDNRIWWGSGESGMPYRKKFLSEVSPGVVPVSWWDYRFAGSNRNAQRELRNRFTGTPPFDTPKPLQLLARILEVAQPDTVLDFFAGSGTTAEAAIRRTRAGFPCSHISVEAGEHFDNALLPRVRKAVLADEWKDGTPVKHDSVGHVLKYIRLESYEDALDNLQLRERSGPQQQLLAASPEAREDYMLSYMLDVETQGSASLLNIEQFKDPFNYKLRVTRNNETRVAAVDLVETFNYLIGLRVNHMAVRVHRTGEFERDEHGRLQLKGKTRRCEPGDGWTFRVIQGRSSQDEHVLVIWRVLTDDPEKDNLMLDTFCKKMGFGTKDTEFDTIYVNGDNNLENLRRDEDTWKVQLIEESFHRLMFDVRDV